MATVLYKYERHGLRFARQGERVVSEGSRLLGDLIDLGCSPFVSCVAISVGVCQILAVLAQLSRRTSLY